MLRPDAAGPSIDRDVEFDLVDRQRVRVGIDDAQADQTIGLGIGDAQDRAASPA